MGEGDIKSESGKILTETLSFFGPFYFFFPPTVSGSPSVMKSLRLPATVLFCLLLLIKGLGAAPPGHPEAQPPPPSSEHKEPVAGDAVLGSKDVSALEVRAARNSEPQDEGELFQGVDPRALAAVLLQALQPRPAARRRGPGEARILQSLGVLPPLGARPLPHE